MEELIWENSRPRKKSQEVLSIACIRANKEKEPLKNKV